MNPATRSTLWAAALGLIWAGTAAAQPYMGGPEPGYNRGGYGYDYPPMGQGNYGRQGYGYGPSQGYDSPRGYGYCPPGCVPAPGGEEPQRPRRSMPTPPPEPTRAAPMTRDDLQKMLDERMKAMEKEFEQSRKAAEERMQQMEKRQEAERKAYQERMETMHKRQDEMLEQMRQQSEEALDRFPETGDEPASSQDEGDRG
jgi:hypothetical protein